NPDVLVLPGGMTRPLGNTLVPSGNTFVPSGRIRVPSGNTRVPSGRIRVPSGLTMVPSGNRRDPSGRRTPPRELPELSPVRLFVPVFGGSIRPPLRLVLLLVPVGCDVGLLTRGRFVPIEEMALFLSPPPVLELLSALPLPSNFGGSANTGALETVV